MRILVTQSVSVSGRMNICQYRLCRAIQSLLVLIVLSCDAVCVGTIAGGLGAQGLVLSYRYTDSVAIQCDSTNIYRYTYSVAIQCVSTNIYR